MNLKQLLRLRAIAPKKGINSENNDIFLYILSCQILACHYAIHLAIPHFKYIIGISFIEVCVRIGYKTEPLSCKLLSGFITQIVK